MNNVSLMLHLLPVLVGLAEIILGARAGKLKKAAVERVVFRLLAIFAPQFDTAEFREFVSERIEELVKALNDSSVFKKTTEPKPAL